ncbi:MAG: hypothetical protein KJ069_06770 [Anaerolineae bacterium]|nr:hypothetical protein [Anaerolineae bacterium]
MAAIVTISGRCGQTAVALSGLGIFIAVISRNARLTVLYSQAIFLPSMIISGVMLPFGMLPPFGAGAAGFCALCGLAVDCVGEGDWFNLGD